MNLDSDEGKGGLGGSLAKDDWQQTDTAMRYHRAQIRHFVQRWIVVRLHISRQNRLESKSVEVRGKKESSESYPGYRWNIPTFRRDPGCVRTAVSIGQRFGGCRKEFFFASSRSRAFMSQPWFSTSSPLSNTCASWSSWSSWKPLDALKKRRRTSPTE